MKQIFLTLMSFFLLSTVWTQQEAQKIDHNDWDIQLKKYVSNGKVDYSNWIKEKNLVENYLNRMSQVNHKTLSRNERLAFYINVYNATTIKLIMDNFPVKSIKDIPRRWDKPYVRLIDGTTSLQKLEDQYLRDELKESRIHFAINCASIGCPDLLTEAYTGETIENQLDQARINFLKNTQKGAKASNEKGFFGGHLLYLSKIFSWFDGDFERETGSVVNYIGKHGTQELQDFVKKHKGDISTRKLDYDWSLNGS